MNYEDQVVSKKQLNKGCITLIRRPDCPDLTSADRLIAQAADGEKLSRKEQIERSRDNKAPEWWELSSASDSTEELVLQDISRLSEAQQRQMHRALRVYKRAQHEEKQRDLAAAREKLRLEEQRRKQAHRQAEALKPREFQYGYQKRVDQLNERLSRCKYQVFQTSKYAEFLKPSLTQAQLSELECAKNAKLAVLADKAFRATGTDTASAPPRVYGKQLYKCDRNDVVKADNTPMLDIRKTYKNIQPRTPAWDIGEHERYKRARPHDNIGPGAYELRKFVDWRFTDAVLEPDVYDFV